MKTKLEIANIKAEIANKLKEKKDLISLIDLWNPKIFHHQDLLLESKFYIVYKL